MSIDAGTCCESGEEFLTETVLPLGHDQQQLPSRFKRAPTVVAACLERVHTATNTMAQRVGMVLENHLSGFVQRQRETSHPRDETPHQTWRYNRLMRTARDLLVNISVVAVLMIAVLMIAVLMIAVLMIRVLALQGITDQASIVPNNTTIRGP